MSVLTKVFCFTDVHDMFHGPNRSRREKLYLKDLHSGTGTGK